MVLLEAALNGGRSPDQHSAIPVSAAQIAAAAQESAAAGAGAVHFHVRDGDGRETLAAAWVARAVAEMRKHRVPFGVSTGAWIISDPARRLRAVEEWTVLPDFVSINFHEEGAAELAAYFSGDMSASRPGWRTRSAPSASSRADSETDASESCSSLKSR